MKESEEGSCSWCQPLVCLTIQFTLTFPKALNSYHFPGMLVFWSLETACFAASKVYDSTIAGKLVVVWICEFEHLMWCSILILTSRAVFFYAACKFSSCPCLWRCSSDAQLTCTLHRWCQSACYTISLVLYLMPSYTHSSLSPLWSYPIRSKSCHTPFARRASSYSTSQFRFHWSSTSTSLINYDIALLPDRIFIGMLTPSHLESWTGSISYVTLLSLQLIPKSMLILPC